jgi:PAS domain S-box-containing protein
MNSAAECVFGLNSAEAIGATIDRLLPAIIPTVAPWMNNLFPAPTELQGIRADGTAVPLEVTCSRVPVSNKPLYLLILREISERKRSEAALRTKEAECARALAEQQSRIAELQATLKSLRQTLSGTDCSSQRKSVD